MIVKNISFIRKQVILTFLSAILLWSYSYGQDLKRYEFSQPKMGTEFRIVFYCQSDSLAEVIQNSVFKKIDFLNTIYSDYELNSELNQIVKFDGRDTTVKVSDSLYELLQVAQMISNQTSGAFDVTVGPLSKLWRRAIRRNEFPSDEEVQKAKKLVNNNNFKLLGNNTLQLLKNGMRLDLGGIAKGATIDEVFDLIHSYDIKKVLVDGGGDIRVGEAPPGKEGWSIEFPSAKYVVEEMALATSGDTYKYIENKGQRYSHIIDPRTGYGVKDVETVVVTGSTCRIVDALASAASILTKKESERLKSEFNVMIYYFP